MAREHTTIMKVLQTKPRKPNNGTKYKKHNPSKLIKTKWNSKKVVFSTQTLMWDTCAPQKTLGPAYLCQKHNYCNKHTSIYDQAGLQHFPLPAPCIAALILTRCDVWYPFLSQNWKSVQDCAHIKGLAATLWKPAVTSSHRRCLDRTLSSVSEKVISENPAIRGWECCLSKLIGTAFIIK